MQYDIDRRRTVWIVDDSATDADRVRRLLSTTYDVQIISDGAAALERLTSEATPDLLILDWVMPGVSGLEVCRYMRSTKGRLQQIPVILLTARHGSAEIIQAFESGANDYIAKPYVDSELLARVRALLESKRHLERAEKAEADVRILLAEAPDPIFAVDAQGNIFFVNEEGLGVLGLKESEVIGQPLDKLIPKLSTSSIKAGVGESMLPIPDIKIANRIFSPSIRILPSDSAATTTIALRDVTARRKSDARRLDFYSIIAHDLRTPINSVMLRLQLALRGAHGVLPAGLVTDIRQADKSLRSLVGMINDFLELAKLEGAGYKVDKKELVINQVISETLEDFAPLMEKKDLKLNHINALESYRVMGDIRRLSQVLSNLIGNAIKFTPHGGSITLNTLESTDYIEVSVIDTGRGIGKEHIPNLFERFSRIADSADMPGTGLGLMIAREIIEAHGGVIGVESELDVGSRFWFRLPKYQPKPSADHNQPDLQN